MSAPIRPWSGQAHPDAMVRTDALRALYALSRGAPPPHPRLHRPRPRQPTWEARRTNRVEAAYKARDADPEDAPCWILATQAHTLARHSGSFTLSQVVPSAHDMLSRIDRG